MRIYEGIEHIIVDNLSSDGTVRMVEKYGLSNTRIISEADSGTSEAVNKGVRIAKGDMIGLISSDDYYTFNALRKVLNADSEIVYGDTILMTEDEKISVVTRNPRPEKLLAHMRFMCLNCQSFFISRDLMLKYPYDESFHIRTDYEHLLRLLTHEPGILKLMKKIDSPLAVYRWRSDSLSALPSERYMEENARIRERYKVDNQVFSWPFIRHSIGCRYAWEVLFFTLETNSLGTVLRKLTWPAL